MVVGGEVRVEDVNFRYFSKGVRSFSVVVLVLYFRKGVDGEAESLRIGFWVILDI